MKEIGSVFKLASELKGEFETIQEMLFVKKIKADIPKIELLERKSKRDIWVEVI